MIGKNVRRRLPDERRAIVHRFEIAGHKGYIILGLYDDGKPGEIFIAMSKEGSTLSGLLDNVAVASSLLLQNGVPLETLVRKFSSTRYEPSGLTKNRCLPIATSITDYIFRWLGLKFLSLEILREIGVVTKCHECHKVITHDGEIYPCISCVI